MSTNSLCAALAAMLLFSLPSFAATAEDPFARLLAEAGAAEQRHEPTVALELYRQAHELRPDDAFVLQKMAQQISDGLWVGEGAAATRERIEEAMRYARRAVELDPQSAVNQLSVGVLYGRLIEFVPPSEKVEYARRIREHAERAAALDPGYAWAHHALGRWHLEMASVGAVRRALVAVFVGGLPGGSREEGIRRLEMAVELEPEAIAHRVELGFAYQRAGRREDARREWERSLQIAPTAIHDPLAQERARKGLSRIGS